MSKEIAQVVEKMPAFLKQVQSRIEDYTSGVTAGMPLPMLSFRGKEFRFRKDGHEVNTRQRDLEVIFVAPRKGVSKRYYAKQYTAGETAAPDCFSTDGITPDVANPVHDNCAKCPNNAWGSKITESGKEAKLCQDYKRVCVAPLIRGSLMDEPVVLDIPATSLRTPKGFKGTEYMFREYMGVLAKHDIPVEGVVTALGFTDAEYPQLCFSFSRFASQKEFEQVQSMKGLPTVAEVLNEPVYEAAGKIEESTGKFPQEKEKPELTPELTPEPAPEPKKEEDASVDDEASLMAELESVLGGK